MWPAVDVAASPSPLHLHKSAQTSPAVDFTDGLALDSHTAAIIDFAQVGSLSPRPKRGRPLDGHDKINKNSNLR
jgi:hypothetical protein